MLIPSAFYSQRAIAIGTIVLVSVATAGTILNLTSGRTALTVSVEGIEIGMSEEAARSILERTGYSLRCDTEAKNDTDCGIESYCLLRGIKLFGTEAAVTTVLFGRKQVQAVHLVLPAKPYRPLASHLASTLKASGTPGWCDTFDSEPSAIATKARFIESVAWFMPTGIARLALLTPDDPSDELATATKEERWVEFTMGTCREQMERYLCPEPFPNLYRRTKFLLGFYEHPNKFPAIWAYERRK